MKYIHLAFAVLAAWRIVELFTVDRVTAPLRKAFPYYIWQCQRCLSIWAGTYVAIVFLIIPYLNWPFAISWLYFTHNDFVYVRRLKKSRQLHVEVTSDNQVRLLRSELNPSEIQALLSQMIAQSQPQSAPKSS